MSSTATAPCPPGRSEGQRASGFGVVVAFKQLGRAKSRLQGVPPALRERLVQLMLVHTVAQLQLAGGEVVVVSGTPGTGALLRAHGLDAQVVPDPGGGLNAAFTAGSRRLAHHSTVVACMADLAGLRGDQVDELLERVRAETTPSGRWFVSDLQGTGTTMLLARDAALDPLFGEDSAARHRASGATELPAGAGLRRDVDTLADLVAAASEPEGGEPWRALLEGPAPASWDTGTVVGRTVDELQLIRADGTRVGAPVDRLAAELTNPAPGQRLHLAVDSHGAVLHLWL